MKERPPPSARGGSNYLGPPPPPRQPVCGFHAEFELAVKQSLSRSNDARRLGDDRRGEMVDLMIEAIRRNATVDQAALHGGRSIDELARNEHLKSGLAPHVARQRNRRRRTEKTDID